MKKLILILLFISMLIGCSNNSNNTISKDTMPYLDFDEYLKVSCPIDRYHLIMSSVPGLPLDIKILKELSNHTIEISVTSGHLLLWTDGVVDRLEGDYSTEYKDNIIYWSPLGEDEIVEKSDVIVEVKSGDEVVLKAEYKIVLSEDGYVLLQLVLTDL